MLCFLRERRSLRSLTSFRRKLAVYAAVELYEAADWANLAWEIFAAWTRRLIKRQRFIDPSLS